ncbi:MAG: DUF1266 domain-containing protein [Gordonia sp. (in: high G+C Gram-positive bacteria)]|uniref:DUF1266 domain-containing protein n=1 Tax=Gordonia sp. (in: high G+C Gram-positive bacteria) TaxID=84139 RepID=UPI0039E693BE
MTSFNWLDQPKYSADQVRALAPAAIFLAIRANGKDVKACCDDFDLDGAKWITKRMMKGSWGVTDRASALAMGSALLEGMHGPEFDGLLELILPHVGDTPEQQRAFIDSLLPDYGMEVASDAGYFLAALRLPQMPHEFRSTYAWDLVRMAFVVRTSVGLGYLTADEAWPLLTAGVNRARQFYPSWQDFGTAYAVGRALWASDGEHFSAEQSLAESQPALQSLLSDPSSPWVRLPW